jgi:glycosyltransferase involved in cell wall biosynthesis
VKILLLTPQPPLPARQGTALRNWGILRHLAARHAVTLLSLAPAAGAAPPPELAAACRAIHLLPAPVRAASARLRTAAAGRADLADRLWSPEFAATLQRLITDSPPDVVQVEGLELGRYLDVARQCRPGLPIVYDAHNAEVTIQWRGWRSDRATPSRWLAAAYSRLQVGRLARLETAVCRQADAVTCVSDTDAAALQKLVPGLRPVVVPNGIELADYTPPAEAAATEPLLTFTGKMDYRPNVDAAVWFASDILPIVQRDWPAARLQVIGQQPTARLLRHHGRGGVEVVGAVADIQPYIKGCAVYVAPLRMGGGTRFKLLEAMALARPVVSTTIGAEGFGVASGRELLIADDAYDFAQAVILLLGDRALAAQLGRAGRAFVEAAYDWGAILPRLEALHQQLVARSAMGAASG